MTGQNVGYYVRLYFSMVPLGPMKRIGCIFGFSLCPVSAVLAAPPLPADKIDIQQTSLSGVPSGGAMSVQKLIQIQARNNRRA